MITRRRVLQLTGLCALAMVGGPRRSVDASPARPPKRSVRWAMVVDLEKCRRKPDCEDCIAACHRAHNVPDIPEPRLRVRWLGKEPFRRVFPEQGEWAELQAAQGVPVLCNHCDEPPCAKVCPTKATWKRDDGIVMMDWHRCIGCKYCVVACPYGARSFNFVEPRPHVRAATSTFPTRAHGVVEKCTFCAERIAAGQKPVCVDACPERAMTFGNLADPASAVRELLRRRVALRRRPELGTGPAVFYLG
jgi:molybdopterin-containing oxidoreductase family iron-sulfur binding subunit